ncbi:hypothetical protein [Rhabdaerophilum sp. SD176]|uniref:hypothetical protein n=1 Tax=Rhabdaerophilum sp. SD176 TaxID=2983548 RepID=UPI0024DFB83A|nr:hypothetical protein [Rhabdaerophilum sp. SD176]
MIELVLVFILGMAMAGVIWLIMLPAFWRRATRLTRDRLERNLPMSVNEIAAFRDRTRAESAVEIARLGMQLQKAQASVAAARAETGERIQAQARLSEEIETERRRILALEAEIGSLRVEIQTRDLRIADLESERDHDRAAIDGLERQVTAQIAQQEAATELAENRRIALDEARVLAERAREALAAETQRSSQLRNDLQAKTAELRDLERKVAGIENGALLQRIRGGEETYQSAIPLVRQKQVG